MWYRTAKLFTQPHKMEFTETEYCKKAMQTFPNKDGHLQSARIALTFFSLVKETTEKPHRRVCIQLLAGI